MEVTAITEGDQIIEPLYERVLGRISQEDIYNPLSPDEEIIVRRGDVIDEDKAEQIAKCGIEKAKIRSVMSCESKRGVCVKCYGRDLARGYTVKVGEAVGVIAAQSIGEPGTQLTLRTFHIGGTTSRILEQSKIRVGYADTEHVGLQKGEIGSVKYILMNIVLDRKGRPIVIGRNGRFDCCTKWPLSLHHRKTGKQARSIMLILRLSRTVKAKILL